MRKITLIGAGSAIFTRGLLADLIVEGSEWEVALVDIDPDNLEIAFRLGKLMVEATGAQLSISSHTDRTEALPGSDAVVTTIAVGGRKAWETDVFIPRKYGISQPVGDTIMPGGISRALRTIPPMIDIANDVVKLAPQAHFFNYANPMAAICRAVRKTTPAKLVGLCHGVPGVERYLAKFIDVPLDRCRFTAVGMNHLTWFIKFEVDGADAWPLVRERYAALEKDGKPFGDSPDDPLSWELFHVFGAFPAVMDRHVSEFFPQFHRTGEHYGKTLGVDRFSFENTIERGNKRFASMTDEAFGRTEMPDNITKRNLGEHEKFVEILNSLRQDSETVYSVIVPNEGQVTNISRDFAIECPASISKKGVVPLPVGPVPTGVRATVEKALLTIELAVEAAVERDRNKLLQALIVDGSVKSIAEAGQLADEMLAAHREYLPGW